MGIEGLDFNEGWERRVEASWDEIRANFISIHDLIANKEKVARPQDLIDVKNLRTKLQIDP